MKKKNSVDCFPSAHLRIHFTFWIDLLNRLFTEDNISTVVDCSIGTFSLLIAAVQLGCSYIGLDTLSSRYKSMCKSNYESLTSLIQTNCSSAMIINFLDTQKQNFDFAKSEFHHKFFHLHQQKIPLKNLPLDLLLLNPLRILRLLKELLLLQWKNLMANVKRKKNRF